MDQNLKWAKEPDLYWLQAPLLKEPKNSPLVHYPVYYHRNWDASQSYEVVSSSLQPATFHLDIQVGKDF